MTREIKQVEKIENFVSFISERYIIGIEEFETQYKIFQIIFGKEGSIFINFPYYLNNEGLISLGKIPGNIKLPTNLSLLPHGKATANLVKYSHHPDGNVHFSQSGKIFTSIRKKSIPLNNINGHLFTVLFQGINDFKTYTPKQNNNTSYLKRKSLFFKLSASEPDSIKIVGRIYSKDYFLSCIKNKNNEPKEPKAFYKIGEKIYKPALILCPPLIAGYGNYVVTITYDEIPKIDGERYSRLIFLGGFDEKKITRNHSQDTYFLAFIYPVEDFEKLKKLIGCVDYK